MSHLPAVNRNHPNRRERRRAYRHVLASFLPHIWSEFRVWIVSAALALGVAVWLVL